MEMICLMHEGSPYGHLMVGEKVILPPNLARMIGATLDETEGYLEELDKAGVFSKTETQVIYSRRMIRDEEIRASRAAGGIKGGNPALIKVNGKDNLIANLMPTPSSASSSAPAFNNPLPPASPSLGRGRDVLPTTEEAKAIAILFHRRLDTAWSGKEIIKFKDLIRRQIITTEAIVDIAGYYAHERAKGGDGQHRRDMQTFLNNFDGELDRARAFKQNPNAHEKRPANLGSGSSRNVGHNANLDYSQRPARKAPNGAEGSQGESEQPV